RFVQRCTLPTDAAIGRDVHLADLAVAAPGEAPDFVKPRAAQWLFRAGKGDHGFGVDQPGEAARRTVGHQVGIFRRLLARVPRPVAELDAAQPFDADIAFPAGHYQP